MTICVHLTAESNVKHILRSGIKAQPGGVNGVKGVYCMPVLQNYYASHQWLRELRQGGGRNRMAMIAVDFRLHSDEAVLVGHYAQPHVETTVSQAAKVIMSAQDPMGFEIFLPRSVKRDEIHKIRSVAQVIGWRYSPTAKGTKPFCTCEYCIRGTFGAKKLRALRPDSD